MLERKEVKGQRSKKAKLDPQVEMKLKSRKSGLIIEEVPEDMKLLPLRSLQGIKDERLLGESMGMGTISYVLDIAN